MKNLRSGFLLVLLLNISNPGSSAFAEASLPQGKGVFEKWCSTCHGNSVTKPGTALISVRTGSIETAALETRADLHPVMIETVVRNGIGWMPTFRKTEINDEELSALIDYLTQ